MPRPGSTRETRTEIAPAVPLSPSPEPASESSTSLPEEAPTTRQARTGSRREEDPFQSNSSRQRSNTRHLYRNKNGTHFGEADFVLDTIQSLDVTARMLDIEEEAVTWHDMWFTCCLHTPREWLGLAGGTVALLACLYAFYFALHLMRNSSKVMAGCATGSLFENEVRKQKGTPVELYKVSTLWC
jgi:hypothetical protein